jgi:hypothetical protein
MKLDNPLGSASGSIALSPHVLKAVNEWSSSIKNPTVPGQLFGKSTILAVADEGAKLLGATFMYGERTGKTIEIPYDHGTIRNTVDDLASESLWLYGTPDIPPDFSTKSSEKPFIITTGETHKCSKCRGHGKVTCTSCKGKVRWTEKQGDNIVEKVCSCGDGKEACGTCDGFGWMQNVIQCKTEFKTHDSDKQDYEGEIPKQKLQKTSGRVLFEETIDYPLDEMRGMLKGGINAAEYAQLQKEVADRFHSAIKETLTEYDGDIALVHGLVDEFFAEMPNAVEKNKLFKHEMLPIRLKIKVEDSPVSRVNYKFKETEYRLWVYGNERKVHAPKKPFSFTPRLIGIAVVIAAVVGFIVFKHR